MMRLFIILLLLNGLLKGQTSTQVDTLVNDSKDLINAIKLDEALDVINKAEKMSREINYSLGLARLNVLKSAILVEQGKYDETLKYLAIAKKQADFMKDYYVVAEFYRIRGRVRANLELYNYAVEDFRLQLYYSKKIGSNKKRGLGIFYSYQNMLQSFEWLKQKDSVWKYAHKMEESLSGLGKGNKAFCSVAAYTKIANLNLDKSDLKNALIYNKRAEDIANRENMPKFDIYENYAIINNQKGDYREAGNYYEKAFINSYEFGFIDLTKYYAIKLAKFYNDKDKERSLKFFTLANTLDNSLSESKKKARDKLIEELIISKQEDQKRKTSIIIILCTALILTAIFIFIYKRRKYKRRINYKEALIEESQKKITETEIQNIHLNRKNEHLAKEVEEKKFQELIDFAKNNNPEFLVLFNELYPNLIFRLKELNPRIRNSELAFCALAYLNFTTKDIAEYTFVAIATVHSRKNRFRKKYNIPSDEDFNVWMRELGDK
ncbi:helix-turn-helix transcriptional regulator [Cloacibacterium sp.]|uniref:helix-turn-helix transcriptional regulator n=1 Tax=Cloacibacterium sp. TaxID=1913682 RepID=UPI0039E3B348